MKTILGSSGFMLVALGTAVLQAGMIDITRPGDPVLLISGTNDGDGSSGPPPANEPETNAIDDTTQKYLNFLDRDSGFAVTPSANPSNLPVTGLRLYTANDQVPRDPASYVLSGSNGTLDGPWSIISAGLLNLPEGRNPGNPNALPVPPTGNPDAFQQTVSFDNSVSYSHYRLTFPLVKDEGAANSMQIGEVEFLVVPEPSSLALLGMALCGLLIGRRRR